MYYLISFLIIILWTFISVLLVKAPIKEEKLQFSATFQRELLKGLSKCDLQNRKKRLRSLPLWNKLLYEFWFSSIIFIMLLVPLVLLLLRRIIIANIVCPKETIFLYISGSSQFVFGLGAFLLGIPIIVGYSYLTNKGVIRKADIVYQLGSFQEYPKKMNIFISSVCGLIALPIIVIPCNSYQYATENEIVNKRAFSMSEAVYDVESIDYAERVEKTAKTVNGPKTSYRYKIITKSGESFWLGEFSNDDTERKLLERIGIKTVNT